MSELSEGLDGALKGARAWLALQGTPLEAALADACLGLREPGHGERALARCQDARGAVAWREGDDELAGTIRALHWLRALDRTEGALAEGAARFLASQQRPDGGIGEGEECTLVTARALAALACTARVRGSVLLRAGELLAAQWSPDALAEGGEAAVCAWFPALCHAPGELADFADGALQWCGRELERGFRTGRVSPLAAASVFVAADAHALPGARLSATEVATAALRCALPDGSFPGGAAASLEALRSLHYLAAATGDRSC